MESKTQKALSGFVWILIKFDIWDTSYDPAIESDTYFVKEFRKEADHE